MPPPEKGSGSRTSHSPSRAKKSAHPEEKTSSGPAEEEVGPDGKTGANATSSGQAGEAAALPLFEVHGRAVKHPWLEMRRLCNTEHKADIGLEAKWLYGRCRGLIDWRDEGIVNCIAEVKRLTEKGSVIAKISEAIADLGYAAELYDVAAVLVHDMAPGVATPERIKQWEVLGLMHGVAVISIEDAHNAKKLKRSIVESVEARKLNGLTHDQRERMLDERLGGLNPLQVGQLYVHTIAKGVGLDTKMPES